MTFSSPWYLLSLLAPALGALGLWAWRRRAPRYTVPFTNVGVLAQVATRSNGWRRHLTGAFVLMSLAALCIGLARPKMTWASPYEKASVVLVLDVSGSMRAEDVEPTRLEAAQKAILRFLEVVPKEVRVGLVAFSSTPEVLATPTTDRDRIRESLRYVFPDAGTAIGDALARAAQLARSAVVDETGGIPGLKPGDPFPATVLFLSDGSQRNGVLTPDEGAAVARKARVPVHTVALGTNEGVIEIERFGEIQVIPVPPDPITLQRIAEATGGKAYEISDAAKLEEVYANLGDSLGRIERPHEVTVAFVGVGAALLGAAGLLAGLWAPRIP